MLGVKYPPGYLQNPKNYRTRSSLVILGPEGNLQIDCPPEMRLQLTSQEVYELAAVLITHAHSDHVMGMDDLRSICILTGKPIPVFTLPKHQEHIRRIFPYAFLEPPPGVAYPKFDLFDVSDTVGQINVAGMEIKTFVVPHGRESVIGIRVGGLAYITDVSEIPDEVFPLLEGLDTFIVDAVRLKPHPNHFHLAKALEVAKKVGAKQTFLTHLSHDYDHDVTNAGLPANVQLAFDGMRIPINLPVAS